MKSAAIAFIGLAGVGLGLAGGAQAQDVRSLGPGAAPASATLEDLRGLFGDWAGKDAAAGFSAPAVGEVVGHLLLYTDKGPRVQEMWVFRPEGNSIVLRQKHYDPALADREEKDKWGERKLVAIDPGHVFLENLTWVTRGDSLDLYVRIAGQNGAPPTFLTYNLKRVK